MTTTKMPLIADPDPATFYLVPDGTGSDSLIEWINLGGTWEKFGSTRIDLSNYVQKTDIATSSAPGLVKPNAGYGTRMGDGAFQNTIIIAKADEGEVKNGTNNYKPIVPSSEHAATFFGLAKAAGDSTQAASDNPVGTYTEDAKNAIKEMLGIEESEPDVTPGEDIELVTKTETIELLSGEPVVIPGEDIELVTKTETIELLSSEEMGGE